MATINGIPGRQSYAWFTSISNGTQVLNYQYDQCVALANLYHQSVIGGSFVPCMSAYQWWTNFAAYGLGALYTQSQTPVAGAIFVGRGGIYNVPDGHIGVVTGVNANGTFNTMEQNSNFNRYVGRGSRGFGNGLLGFLIPRNNPATPAITGTQRVVGANPVKRRAGATSASQEIQPPLSPGIVGNFVGFAYGQNVNDGIAETNIWYKGTSGNFFWAGGFTKISTDSLPNLTPVTPVSKDERKVGANPSNIRSTASSPGAVQGSLKAGAVVKVSGWIKGQAVNDGIGNSNIWFKVSNGWAWAGAFTSQSTADLKDLNPAPTPPATDERKVGANPSNIRATANTTGAVKGTLQPGVTVKVLGWANGQAVNDGVGNTKIWFKVAQGWAWAGAFTSQSTAGLIDLNSEAEPTPTPPTPSPEFEYLTPNIKALDLKKLLPWCEIDVQLDTEIGSLTAQQWNTELYEYYAPRGAQQYQVQELHAHWWGDPSAGATHNGVVSYIQSQTSLTVNQVVSDSRITTMMPLDYAATTTGGPVNMRGIKFEIDPTLTEGVYKTVGALLYVIERENPKLGELPVRLHKEFAATACSEIEPAKVREWANKFKTGQYDILTGQPKASPAGFPLTLTVVVQADGSWSVK